MSGTQTRGFDAVLEVAETVVSDTVLQYLTYDGTLCQLGNHMIAELMRQLAEDAGVTPPPAEDDGLSEVGDLLSGLTPAQKGHLAGLLDGTLPVPTFLCFPDEVVSVESRVELPAGVTLGDVGDTMTIMAFVRGEAGASLSLELVVGIVVAQVAGVDTIALDFDDSLHHGEATLTVAGEEITLNLAGIVEVLGDLLEPLPLIPVPVERDTDDPATLKRVDVFTIDDMYAADRDAVAVGMTFGGGMAGDVAAFDRAVIPDGSTGALMMSHLWLCRLIGRQIESELHLSETSSTTDGCTWEGEHDVEADGETLTLTRIRLTAHDGHMELTADLYKDDGCAHADVRATVRITAGVTGGEVGLDAVVEDPVVDNDTPWWCYLVGAIVGAVVGAVLGAFAGGWIGAIIGAVVGAVVGVVVVFLVEIVSDPIGTLAGQVSDIIGSTVGGLRVSAPALSVVPVDAFIDDVTVALDIRPSFPYPIRSEGILTVREGQGIDLDRGGVLPVDTGGIDLGVTAVETVIRQDFGFFDVTRTVTQARIEALCGAAVAPSGTWSFDAVGRFTAGRLPFAINGVIGPRHLTSLFDAAAAAFGPTRQVIAVRTNENRYAIVQVVDLRPGEIDVRWRTWEAASGTVQIAGGFACGPWVRIADVKNWSVLPPLVSANRGRSASKLRFRGTWSSARSTIGHYEAILDRPSPNATAAWRLDGNPLVGIQGAVSVDGQDIEYEQSDDGLRILLRLTKRQTVNAFLEVDVETSLSPAHHSICIAWEPECDLDIIRVPPLATWSKLAAPHLGAIPVLNDSAAHAVTFEGAKETRRGQEARP